MKRHELEHLIRASAAITGASEIVVIGSQAILAHRPDPPEELLKSVEADLFTFRSPHDADLIDGSIGELSPFHNTYSYHAHGVSENTAVLPSGWRGRLVPLKSPATGGATGLCLEVHDLAVSKLVAGREKDLDYVRTLLRHGLATASVIRERLGVTQLDAERRTLCEARIARLEAGANARGTSA